MDKVRATPAARAMAEKLNLELNQITGTGPNGRIQKEDVTQFSKDVNPKITPLAKKIAEANNIDIHSIKGTGFNGKIVKEDVLALITEAPTPQPVQQTAPTVQPTIEAVSVDEIIPMTAMRKVIAKRMSDSYFTAPTFTLNYEIDMSALVKLRKELLEPIKEKTGFKVTYTDLIAYALSKVLIKKEHQYINSSLSEDGQNIILHNYVSVALAVGFDGGLLVPVLKNTDKMSLTEIVVGLKDIAKRALEMKIKPDEMTGSTITISNIGMYGVKSFNPIINQPNSAILGVSATIDRPVVVNGEITIRPIMELSLTIDHRVIDGLAGAKFMQDLKNVLENPMTMFI